MSGKEPEDPSPWATDAIPVDAAPTEIIWDDDVASEASSGSDTRNISAQHLDGSRDGPPSADNDGVGDEPPGRPWWSTSWWVSAMAAAALLLIAVVVWPGGDDSTSDEPTTTDPSATTTLDTLPDADDAADAEAENDSADPVGGATGTGEPDGGPTTDIGPIELPPPVAAIEQPTELIMQTDTGVVHTLSLPSGNVRSVDLNGASQNSGGFNGGFVVSPDAALFPGFDDDSYIVPRTGPPILVDSSGFSDDETQAQFGLNPVGWLERPDGSVFLAEGYGGRGNPHQLTIGLDGTMTEIRSDAELTFPVFAAGRQVVNDAGGIYLVDAEGAATRISPGAAIGVSERRLLVRECDAARECEYVLQDFDGGNRTVAELPDELSVNRYFAVSLSPDGTAGSYANYDESEARVLLDFASGEKIIVPIAGFGGNTGAWAPDSSGEFVLGTSPGLLFVDRASGETIEFGKELGRVAAIGVRYPDAELLDAAVLNDEVTFSVAPALDTDLRLVTVGRIGGMTLIDIDDATATSWNTPSVPGNPPPQLFADDERVLAVSGNGNDAFVSEFGSATMLENDEIPQGPLFPGPRDGLVWARNPEGTSEIDQTTFNLNGTSPAADVRNLMIADGTLLGGDGTGGMVFESGGGIYVSADGIERLTTGELLAIGATTAIVRECDEQLNCSTFSIDRAIGERTVVEIQGVPGADGVDDRGDFALGGSISPTGGVVLARFTSADGEGDVVAKWAFFDLATGNPTNIEAPEENQPIVWNDDGTYAAFIADGRVNLYERATATIIEVEAGATGVRAFTSVPAEFGPPEPAG